MACCSLPLAQKNVIIVLVTVIENLTYLFIEGLDDAAFFFFQGRGGALVQPFRESFDFAC